MWQKAARRKSFENRPPYYAFSFLVKFIEVEHVLSVL